MKKLKLEKRTKIKKLEKDCKVRQEKIQIWALHKHLKWFWWYLDSYRRKEENGREI
jgi:hypothetical protein